MMQKKLVLRSALILILFTLNPAAWCFGISLSEEDLSLTEIQTNKKFDLRKHDFEYLVIDFWASWCGPCEQSIPFFEEQNNKWASKGVLFLGVNEDIETTEALKFLKRLPIHYSNILDQGRKLSKKFQINSIPRTFVFDKNLNLVKSFRGYTLERKIEMKQAFEELFKKKEF
jgi:thiol-disulfide isomerase/thioredoxin